MVLVGRVCVPPFYWSFPPEWRQLAPVLAPNPLCAAVHRCILEHCIWARCVDQSFSLFHVFYQLTLWTKYNRLSGQWMQTINVKRWRSYMLSGSLTLIHVNRGTWLDILAPEQQIHSVRHPIHKNWQKRVEQSFDLLWLHSKSKLGHFAHFPKEPTFQVKAGTLHWHTGTRDWIWQHFNIVLSLSSSCTNNSVDYDNLIWYLLWYKLQRPLTWKWVF